LDFQRRTNGGPHVTQEVTKQFTAGYKPAVATEAAVQQAFGIEFIRVSAPFSGATMNVLGNHDNDPLDENANAGRTDIGYGRKIVLQQVFRACHQYIAAIRLSVEASTQLLHLDGLDETLQWASVQLCSRVDTSHPLTLLFLHILENISELLWQYVDDECPGLSELPKGLKSQVSESVLSHEKAHVFFKRMAEELVVDANESARLKTYVHTVQRDINQASENAAALEKVLIGTEMWSDQLAALALLLSPRYVDGLKDSVQMALEGIKHVVGMGENE
jgi:hypothetical protein